MVSDDERREVAARLRKLAGSPEIGGFVYNDDVLDALGMERGRTNWLTTPGSVARLADLIGGPEVPDEGDGSYTCTECGWHVDAGDAGSGYCPYCGTKREARDDG